MHPVTLVEVLLQQIADSLVEIRDELRQASAGMQPGAKAVPAAKSAAARKKT